MFRGALSPHKQPLLDDQQPAPHAPLATTKKPAAASLRNLFFGKDEHDHEEPPAQRNVGSARSRTLSQASNKIAPDAVAAPSSVTSPSSTQPSKRSRNPRETFQRAHSQPIRLDVSAALSASRTFDPSMSRAAALDPGSLPSQSQRSPGPLQQRPSPAKPKTPVASEPPSLRSTVYGSCSHVLSTVMSVLVLTIKTHREYIDATAFPAIDGSPRPLDNNTVRKAKLLYIALLEKAQKERGEWQGFGAAEPNNAKKERASSNNNEEEEERRRGSEESGDSDTRTTDESAKGLLMASMQECSKEESFAVLNELLELSFRNLRVALVSPVVYSKHRHDLEAQSLSCPASLDTLVRIGSFVSELSRDEKLCLLHLVSFWCALCVVDPTHQQLQRIVEEKHALVLSESSEMEFMQHAARKSGWADLVAIDLLIVIAQYREMIFSDLEFYRLRQELCIPLLASESEVDTSQPPSEVDSASPEIDVSEGPVEEYQDDLTPVALLEAQASAVPAEEIPQLEPPVQDAPTSNEAHPDAWSTKPSDTEAPLAAPPAPADEALGDAQLRTRSPCEPSSAQDDTDPLSLVVTQPNSPTASPIDQELSACTSPQESPSAVQTGASPSFKPESNKLKSPPAKGPKPKAYASATMVSPRFKRSRLVYPNIHSVAVAVTPRHRRARGGVGDMSVHEVLPYVAVAVAAASLGVLTTVAFFAVRNHNH